MSQPRLKSLSGQFTEIEKQQLVEFLLRPCNAANVPAGTTDQERESCGGLVEPLREQFQIWIKNFLKEVNKTEGDRPMARTILCRLWEANALPRCQMECICTYVYLTIEITRAKKIADAFVEKRNQAMKEIEKATKQITYLREHLTEEEESVVGKYQFPSLNKGIFLILDLVTDCLKAVEEIKSLHKSAFSQQRMTRVLHALRKMALSQAMENVHSSGKIATIADISILTEILHVAIGGRPPDKRERRQYAADGGPYSEDDLNAADGGPYSRDNLSKESTRLFDEPTQSKLQYLVDGFEEILPDFTKRVEFESISEMRPEMRPKQVTVSRLCADILDICQQYASKDYSK
jgi:hypothetical protein